MLRFLLPCLLSLAPMLALLLAGAPARAQGLPADWLQQIERLAEQAAQAAMPPEGRVAVEVGAPDPRLRLAPCQRVEPFLPAGQALWGRSRLGLRCTQGVTRWSISVPLQVRVFAPGWAAQQALPAGSVLLPGQLVRTVVEWSAEPSPVQAQAEAPLGRALQRPLQAGEALRLAHLKPRQWFAAASWVKLPLAGLLLEELERRGLDPAGQWRLEIDSAAACAPLPAAQQGGWPLDALLQSMLVVSDNLAYNALYELLGSDLIHARLDELGYPRIRMATRLGCPQPRSPGKLGAVLRDARGAVAWDSPARAGEAFQRFPHGRARAGRAWADGGRVIEGAHDFSDSNFIPLADVHRMTLEFGGGVGDSFRLSARARRWLGDTLSLLPRQATALSAAQRALPDDHSKWLLPLDGSGHFPSHLRIHGKNAQSYGWIGDSAFVVDDRSGRACAITAVLFVDRDGVLNDGVYDYAGTGRPFLREVGAALVAG